MKAKDLAGEARVRAATVVFGALVAATFGAFFAAQRLKHQPSLVQNLRATPLFSPNRDGRLDRAHVTFKLKRADRVTVEMLDADRDVVRTLMDDRRMAAYEPLKPSLAWDGRDDDGHEVRDGRYKVRILLRDQGRAVLMPRSIVKDTEPPRPRVRSIGRQRGPGPELLPEAGGARVHFSPALGRPSVTVLRTDPGHVAAVVGPEPLATGQTEWTWDGRTDRGGRRAGAGTYLVVLTWRDAAGNVGTSAPLDRRGLPVLGRGRLPGRGGVTVRHVGVQPPVTPVTAGRPVQFQVDSRRVPYTWEIRKVGGGVRDSGGPKTKPTVTTPAPRGVSGLYLFQARARGHLTRVPFAVQARRARAGTAARPRGVLVLAPYVTWQGRNPLDDDGDGAPDLLDAGGPVRAARVLAGGGLPVGFAAHEAPAIGWLDHHRHRYDLTTDLALLDGGPAQLRRYRGVLIPGEARWLPTSVRSALRAFVHDGGTLVSLGTDSLRRTVTLDPGEGRLVDPSPQRATDLFGARIAPVSRTPTALTVYQDDPAVNLFLSASQIPDVTAWEETLSAGRDASILSAAVTPAGKRVFVAEQYGRGQVIRTGLPDFPARLGAGDPVIGNLMETLWTLLSR